MVWNRVKSPSENIGLSNNVLNVKGDPNLIGALREKKGFLPAYHMNKENWISILLDDTVPEEEIKSLIRFSYQLTETKCRK